MKLSFILRLRQSNLLCQAVPYNCNSSTFTAKALRPKKGKSVNYAKDIVDSRAVNAIGGKGGDGCISFLQLWCNEKAGPDGGDGGNGSHVIFEANSNVTGLEHIDTTVKGDDGENGFNKDCNGKNAQHTIIQVPLGTIVKNNVGRIVADLNEDKMMFLAAKGGAGGKGNHYFATDLEQVPKVAEYGGGGENIRYTLELSTIAHFGLLGFPNAGKSTLLQAITRANPKVAAYPFTTLKPHLGIIHYNDLEQISVADLPGLIEGSHQNRGLGISFLRHAERCMGLLVLLDMSEQTPWVNLDILRNEVLCFSEQLRLRPQIIVANKMDVPGAEDNLRELKSRKKKERIVAISAKRGDNLSNLLSQIRTLYDDYLYRQKERVGHEIKSNNN